MGQIVEFPASRQNDSADQAPAYCCTRCDSDRFRLLESGLVSCAGCGAVMGNLGVIPIRLSREG